MTLLQKEKGLGELDETLCQLEKTLGELGLAREENEPTRFR
jgi:hypothetical protein